MSQESAQAFVEQAKEDRAFQLAIRRYVLSRDVGTLIKFGQSHDYLFTAEEIRRAVPPDWQMPRPAQPPSSSGEPRTFDYRTKMLWQGAVVSLLMAIVGLYFARDFAKSYFRYVELRDQGVTTQALVDDRWIVETNNGGLHQTNYYLHFRYTVDGRDYAFHQEVSGDTYSDFGFTHKMEILYNPDKPQQAVLKGTNAPDIWSLAGMIGFGIVSLLLGIHTLTYKRRAGPEVSIQVLDPVEDE